MNKKEFLAQAEARYEALQALNKLDNFYDYEKLFVELWQEFGREVLEQNIGPVPKDRRKKKLHDPGLHKHQ